MGKVVFETSMSLDGFMTASNPRPQEPLGDGGGGQRLQLEIIEVVEATEATHLRYRVHGRSAT
jgi:hypothetical protein